MAAPSPVPCPPEAARACFGSRLALAERYVGLLADTGISWGLLGPREVPKLWERHVLNCAVLEQLVPSGSHVVDIGSGAGLPGIALAIARPDLRVTLVEPMQRRVSWLTDAVADLELPEVAVVSGRAEEVASRVTADVATARAVARLETLVGWALPLLRPGGILLAMKGDRAGSELAAARPELDRRGIVRAEIVHVGEGMVTPATTVVRIVSAASPRADSSGQRPRRRPGRPRRGAVSRRNNAT